MLSCYQCDETAVFCESETRRLFCTRKHRTQYNEGWGTLLRNPRFIESLGTKRSFEQTPSAKLNLVETLPDDMLMEILLFTFHDVANNTKVMRDAINTRETSLRLRWLIDRYILSVVTELKDDSVLIEMDDDDLALFTGLQTLRVSRLYNVFRDDNVVIRVSKLTDVGLTRVSPHLRLLEVYGDLFTDVGFATLSKLEELVIMENNVLSDKGLGELSQLKRLEIKGKSNLDGTSFKNLASLKSLYLYDNESIETKALLFLSRSLIDLTIKYKTLLSYDPGLSTMTKLESLTISDPKIIRMPSFCSNQSLLVLPGLTQIKLFNVSEITNEGLANLTRLRVLDVDYGTRITCSGTRPFVNTLEELRIDKDFTDAPEECMALFPKLKLVSLFTFMASNELIIKWEDATKKRGVELYAYDIDVD